MADIGKLSVQLTANPNPLVSGLGKAVSTIKGMLSQATGVIGGFGGQAGGAFLALPGPAGVAAAAVVGLTRAIAGSVSAAAEAIDAEAKLADRLGVSTEALQGLQHAAGLSGVGQEQLSTALTMMTRQLGEAAGGSATAQAAFARLGLSAAELGALSPDEALERVADGLNALPSPAARTAAAMDLFGRSGAGMINFLAGGGEAMREARLEAEQLGLTVSRIDASAVEEMNDNISRVGAGMQGLWRQLAVAVAPAVSDLAAGLKDVFVAAMPTIKAVFKAVGDFLAPVFRLVKEVGGALKDAFSGGAVSGLGAALSPLRLLLQGMHAVVDALTPAIRALGRVLGTAARLAGELGDRVGSWSERIGLSRGGEGGGRGFLGDYVAGATEGDASTVGGFIGRATLAAVTLGASEVGRLIGRAFRDEAAAAGPALPVPAPEWGDVGMNVADLIPQGVQQALQQSGDRMREQLEAAQGLTEAQRQRLALERQIAEAFGRPIAQLEGAQAAAANLALQQLDEQAAGLADARAEQTVRELTLQREQLGMTQQEIALAQMLRENEGLINRERLEGVRAAQQALAVAQDELRAREELANFARQTAQAGASPLARFQEEVDRIQEAFAGGLLGIDERDLALARAVEQLGQGQEDAGRDEGRLAAALTEGSVAAASAINRAMRRTSAAQEDPQARIARLLEAAERRQQQQLEEARRIRRELEDAQVVRPAGL